MTTARQKLLPYLIALVAAAAYMNVGVRSYAHAETVTVARPGGPPGLGNPFTSVAQPGSGVWSLIFDSLTMFDEARTLQPGLALSWRPTSDTTWEFRLRPGVVFHNGRILDALVIAEAIEILLTDEARSYYVYPNIDSLEAVRVVDYMTIELTTKRPDPLLPRRLSLLMIVEPDTWHALGPDGFAQAPVGSGPYTLKDWGRGNSQAVLDAFAPSWRPAEDVTQVVMMVMPDSVARSQALLSGVVDIVEGASGAFGAAMRSDISTALYPTSQVYMLAYRLEGNDGSPLSDRRVREALTYMVNRTAIADIIYDGAVEPANQPVTPGVLGYNEALPPVPYDLERARSLLAEAGYGQGIRLHAEYVNNSTEEALQMLQLTAQDMSQVGVEMILKATTIQNFFAKWQSGDWGETDLFLAISDGSIFFDAQRPLWLLSCDKPNPWYCNPTTTQKLRETESILDIEQRAARLELIMEEVVADYPAIWLATISARFLTTRRIADMPIRPQGIAFEKIKLR